MTKTTVAPTLDRRTLRTRAALRGALVALIEEYGWDEISVQDVCVRANVGRSTFYSHYPSKDALLVGGFEDLQSALQGQARASARSGKPCAPCANGFGFVTGLIEHAYEQRKLFRGLIGRRSGYVVQQRFREMVLRLVTDELPPTLGKLPREAVARWLSAAFVELLSWWVEQRTLLPPTQIASLFTELAQPVFQARAQSAGRS